MIPDRVIILSKIPIEPEALDVIAVATIGDWIRLSIPIRTLAFWLVETNLWEIPIPTWVISNTLGGFLRASETEAATLTLKSLLLTI